MTLERYDSAQMQTVVDLADYMRRMRCQATELQSQLSASERGFFTPTEDELLERLWISYHKSRAALFELIDSIQRSVGGVISDDLYCKYAGEFAVAYAAALVLVDAARFLRDLFGNHPLVRRKLNESFQLYGVPANSFDKVQLSLTDPTNALQLKDANAFYDAHCDAFHELADEDEGLRRVIGVIDDLRAAVQVPTTRYVRARLAERRRHVKEALIKGNLMRAIYVIQEYGSRLVSCISTNPRHVPRLPKHVTEQLLQMLRPGDVFVTRKDAAVTNYFLPGYWPHAALYVGDDKVVESLKDGVRERSMDSPFGNDAVAVVRPLLTPELIQQAIQRARTHIGKPYDFDFDFTRADRMVCTEVVYRSYEGLQGIQFRLTRRAGRETLSAEDLLRLAIAGHPFQQVAVYCPKFGDQLLLGEGMTRVLQQTMDIE
jgi:Permuted papain-like amidase enzyme, YaeF/YiiX, C92 family